MTDQAFSSLCKKAVQLYIFFAHSRPLALATRQMDKTAKSATLPFFCSGCKKRCIYTKNYLQKSKEIYK